MKVLYWTAAVFLIVSCSVTHDDMDDAFAAANPSATEAQVSCVVDDLVKQYGLEGLEVELEADIDSDEFVETQFRSMIGCGMTKPLIEQVSAQMQSLDVPPEAAPCVVAALTEDVSEADLDVLTSGQITDAYYAKFFDALTECDAIK